MNSWISELSNTRAFDSSNFNNHSETWTSSNNYLTIYIIIEKLQLAVFILVTRSSPGKGSWFSRKVISLVSKIKTEIPNRVSNVMKVIRQAWRWKFEREMSMKGRKCAATCAWIFLGDYIYNIYMYVCVCVYYIPVTGVMLGRDKSILAPWNIHARIKVRRLCGLR